MTPLLGSEWSEGSDAAKGEVFVNTVVKAIGACAGPAIVTIRFLSRLNSAEVTGPLCCNSIPDLPLFASHSHILAIPSSQAVKTFLPSPLNRTEYNKPPCFSGFPSAWHPFASHTCTMPSADAVAISFPSALNVADAI